jgi:glycosyl transferase family 25
MIDNFVDKTYIINLDERKDRWNAIQLQLQKIGLQNYERFPAYKPTLTDFPKTYYDRLTLAGVDHEKYKIAALGSKLSHTQIMRISLSKGYKKILILEDDAEFIDNFNELFENDINELEKLKWDMFFLGANHKNKPISVSKHLLKLMGAYTTHAYIIKDIMMKKIINETLEMGNEFDVYYCDMIHSLGTSFCPKVPLAWQASGFSDVLGGIRSYNVLKKVWNE